MKRRAIDTLASLLLALAVAGCAGLRGLDTPPQVSLVNLQPVQIRLFEQRYLATIRILNPNPVALPIDGLEYAISINGSEFANGVSSQRVTVPAYGEKTLDLGVSSTLAKLFDQIRRFGTGHGTLRYAISGSLELRGSASSVPFSQDGEVDLRLDRPPRGRAAHRRAELPRARVASRESLRVRLRAIPGCAACAVPSSATSAART
jgi:LEA14-like dessication related protein